MKVRSWNEKLKRFIYFENGEYYSLSDEKDKQCEPEFIFNWENVELCSTRADKKGNKAFVGDKLEFTAAVHFKLVDTKGTVVFEQNAIKVRCIDSNGETFISTLERIFDFDKYAKIVGHVHEAKNEV